MLLRLEHPGREGMKRRRTAARKGAGQLLGESIHTSSVQLSSGQGRSDPPMDIPGSRSARRT
jgi:hypothetical protein